MTASRHLNCTVPLAQPSQAKSFDAQKVLTGIREGNPSDRRTPGQQHLPTVIVETGRKCPSLFAAIIHGETPNRLFLEIQAQELCIALEEVRGGFAAGDRAKEVKNCNPSNVKGSVHQ